jgi:hyperosmotically inducible protein
MHDVRASLHAQRHSGTPLALLLAVDTLKELSMHWKVFLLPLVFGVAFTACETEGPAEQAGEKIDQAVEDASEKIENATESAGEKIEEATDSAGEKLEETGDAVREKTS